MAKDFNEIVTDFNNFLSKCGGRYRDYYVGITNDAKRRLFNEHNVDNENGLWIYREGKTDVIAREVEEYFLEKGCKGGPGGGDYESNIVYCYKITSKTIE